MRVGYLALPAWAAQADPSALRQLVDQVCFHATIFRAVRVRDPRLRLSKAFGDQRRGVNSLGSKVRHDRVCATLGKPLIVLFGSRRVGMAVDLELLTFEPRVLQSLDELIEIVLRGPGKLVRIEVKADEEIEMP